MKNIFFILTLLFAQLCNAQDDIDLIKRKANQGDPDAQCKLAEMYLMGDTEGIHQDTEKGIKWLERAAKQDHIDAMIALGIYYEKKGYIHHWDDDDDLDEEEKEYKAEAEKWFNRVEKLAKKGNAYAQFSLGYMYSSNNDELRCRYWKKDDKKSLEWYLKAAKQGLAEAQYNAGNIYWQGRGVDEDEVEALKWFRKAAEQGDAWAQYEIGRIYLHGNNTNNINPDTSEAIKWYRKAAEQGDNEALSALKNLNVDLRLEVLPTYGKPTLHLLAVGVGDYSHDGIADPKLAAKEARDFCNAVELAYNNDDHYKKLEKHLYLDKNATRDNIFDGLRALLAAQPNDVVIIYFNGPCVQHRKGTYLMTVDAVPSKPSTESVSLDALHRNIRKLVDRQATVMVFLDVCDAGNMTIDNATASKPTGLNIDNIIELCNYTNGEDNLPNGLFTTALINGLNDAEANKEGFITVKTLINFFNDFVSKYNSQTLIINGLTSDDIPLFHKK